ncbi:hypothetical protein [Amycolatopsis rubida]|uniref:hypothetical protein n=1 Tax=Amycolatopsis rubida TaxID=112413 RepID=UPI003CC7AC3C
MAERAASVSRRARIAPERVPATVEAASIVAALTAHREGRRFRTAADCLPPSSPRPSPPKPSGSPRSRANSADLSALRPPGGSREFRRRSMPRRSPRHSRPARALSRRTG